MAGSARTLWQLEYGGQPLLSLAQPRDLGSGPGRVTGRWRSARRARLGNSLSRWLGDPRSPARRRGKKSSPEAEAIGRSRGGLTTKIHLRAEGQGKPVSFLLTPGQRTEISQAEQLMQQGAVRRPSGQLRLYPKRVVGDKGYSFRPFRRFLHKKGIRNTIPTRSNQRRHPSFDKEIYRQRNKVERLFNRLKQFRRIATRYEKRAANYAAMLTLAMILLWL